MGLFWTSVRGTLTQGLTVSAQWCAGLSCPACSGDAGCLEGDACTQDVCESGGSVHDIVDPSCCIDAVCDTCVLSGDLNADGAKSLSDVQCTILVSLWIISGKSEAIPTCLAHPLSAADINCDNAVNTGDIILSVNLSFGTLLPVEVDADADGCADACQ